MAARIPLPTRLQLQTLSGLRDAVVGGANAVGNEVVTTQTALAYINAFEDDFLAPMRLIWMRQTDYNITLDQEGRFDLRKMNYPVLEVVSVYTAANLQATQNNAYWQYEQPFDRKDLTSFRKLQGVLNNQPIYTIDNNYVKVWPQQNFYGPLSCSYYADWPRLGDVSATSTLQEIQIAFSGTATASGSLTLTTTSFPTATVNISSGDTPATVIARLLLTPVIYGQDAGGNYLYWTVTQDTPTTVILTAPNYVATNATINVVLTGAAGLSQVTTTTQNALLNYVQTNWWLTNYPYLYFYGALKHVFLYINDMDRMKWASDQATKYSLEMQAISDRADVSDPSDNFYLNQFVQW